MLLSSPKHPGLEGLPRQPGLFGHPCGPVPRPRPDFRYTAPLCCAVAAWHRRPGIPSRAGIAGEDQDVSELRELLSGHSDDILGDGSVIKSIIEEGADPPVYPIFGDECVTHFVGTLPDGRIFNDTMKRDQPFKFSLGAQHVLEGFDEGVATMRQGERALLRLSPEVAYGSLGARDEKGWQVPPDTPVAFDVRLLQVIKAGSDDSFGPRDRGQGGQSESGGSSYSWQRLGAEVLVTLPVLEDVQCKDITHMFQEKKMSLSIKGEAMLEGVPGCDLEPEECYWELVQDGTGKKSVLIHLQKKGSLTARWPETLFKPQ